MIHLTRSFEKHLGRRGCHFYDSEACHFLEWQEVFKFIKSLPAVAQKESFSEKLIDSLANYDPDNEFLAVQQNGDSISVELYSKTRLD